MKNGVSGAVEQAKQQPVTSKREGTSENVISNNQHLRRFYINMERSKRSQCLGNIELVRGSVVQIRLADLDMVATSLTFVTFPALGKGEMVRAIIGLVLGVQ